MSLKKAALVAVLVLGLLGVQHYFAPDNTLAPGHAARAEMKMIYQEKVERAIIESPPPPPPSPPARAARVPVVTEQGVYGLSAKTVDGVLQPLGKYAGKVSIITNVASF